MLKQAEVTLAAVSVSLQALEIHVCPYENGPFSNVKL